MVTVYRAVYGGQCFRVCIDAAPSLGTDDSVLRPGIGRQLNVICGTWSDPFHLEANPTRSDAARCSKVPPSTVFSEESTDGQDHADEGGRSGDCRKDECQCLHAATLRRPWAVEVRRTALGERARPMSAPRRRFRVDWLVLLALVNMLAALVVCLATPIEVLRMSWTGWGWLVSAGAVYAVTIRCRVIGREDR